MCNIINICVSLSEPSYPNTVTKFMSPPVIEQGSPWDWFLRNIYNKYLQVNSLSTERRVSTDQI